MKPIAPDRTTVVVPARNAERTLGDQLSALDRQTFHGDFTVVVVDNASTDDTAAVAAAYQASRYTVRVVRASEPGVNAARNAGVFAAPDGVIALCDADDEVDPGWLDAIVASLSTNGFTGGDLSLTRLNTDAARLMWGLGEIVRISDQASGDRFLPWGCNCAFYKSMWVDLGGFDSRLSGSGDETEFFQRALSSGYRGVPAAGALVHYRLRPGLANVMKRQYGKGRHLERHRFTIGRDPLGQGLPRSLGGIIRSLPMALANEERRYATLRRLAFVCGVAVERKSGRS